MVLVPHCTLQAKCNCIYSWGTTNVHAAPFHLQVYLANWQATPVAVKILINAGL